MIKPADSDEEKEEDSDKAVAVKDDPQFTIAVTRGEFIRCFPKYCVVFIRGSNMIIRFKKFI